MSGIGAVKDVTVGFFDQKKKKYCKKTMSGHFEILNLTGNISLMDERPMVHVHIMYADAEYNARGGHLMAGTKVFAAEICRIGVRS